MPPAAKQPATRKLLAKAALLKMQGGRKPTRKEAAALAAVEEEREETERRRVYRSIPQKHWRQMSGRQAQVLNEQAARYGIPIGQATIDLFAVLPALHRFLDECAIRLAPPADLELIGPTNSPGLERLRAARAIGAELDIEIRTGRLLDPHEAEHTLHAFASRIRAAVDSIRRTYGPEAEKIVADAIDEAEHEWEKHVRTCPT